MLSVNNKKMNAFSSVYITSSVLSSHNSAIEAQNLSHALLPGAKKVTFPMHTQIADNNEVHPIQGEPYFHMSQGSLKQTGKAMDVAIQGEGFFALEGGGYTRDGQFAINATGRLVSMSTGQAILDEGGAPIDLPNQVEHIGENGTLYDASGAEMGRLGVFTFEHAEQMRAEGNVFFTDQTAIAYVGQMRGGYVESANFSSFDVMHELRMRQQAIEYNSEALQKTFENLGMILNAKPFEF